jgi:hypothetical protein
VEFNKFLWQEIAHKANESVFKTKNKRFRVSSSMNSNFGMKQKISHEMNEFIIVFPYLALVIGVFHIYKWLLLAEYHVGYFVYGYSLVEALILAKVILIGKSLGIGERFSGKPLIIPTLYKTMLFALFVLAFSILEHLTSGFLHGKDLARIFQELIHSRYEILARVLMMFVAFIPFFAFGEAMRVIGEVKLFELFFRSGQ